MFSDPERNVREMKIPAAAKVADFGSGSGHYAMALAKAVGESGTVYAVDIQKDLLARTKNQADSLGIKNVEVVWGDLEAPSGSKLRTGSLDALVISNLMFQVEDKKAVATEAGRVVRQGGTVLLVDWTDSFGGIGPSAERVVAKQDLSDLFHAAGFLFEREIEAGAHHYGIIMKRV